MLKSIYLKRRMLLILASITILIILFDLIATFAAKFIPQFYQVIPQNQIKMRFVMCRETLYLVLINIIVFVMRMRRSFPEFFSSELRTNPDVVGLDLGNGFVANQGGDEAAAPGAAGAAGPGSDPLPRRLLPKVHKLRLKRSRLLQKSCDIDSDLSEVLRQAPSREGRLPQDHQFVVLNPIQFSNDEGADQMSENSLR